jgi:hypothetical protein
MQTVFTARNLSLPIFLFGGAQRWRPKQCRLANSRFFPDALIEHGFEPTSEH